VPIRPLFLQNKKWKKKGNKGEKGERKKKRKGGDSRRRPFPDCPMCEPDPGGERGKKKEERGGQEGLVGANSLFNWC